MREDYIGVFRHPKKLFLALGLTFVIGAFTAILGKYKEITSWILLPALIVQLIWYFSLLRNYKEKRMSSILLLTYNYILLAICSLICCYKLLHFAMIEIGVGIMISVVSLHLVVPILSFNLYQRKILTGIVAVHNTIAVGSLLTIGALGYIISGVIGRIIRNNASNETAVLIVVMCLLFFSISGMIGGTKFLLKYHLLRQYKERLIHQGIKA